MAGRSVEIDLSGIDFSAVRSALGTDGGTGQARCVSKSVFAGKRAASHVEIRWVAENLRVSDVQPEDAPSAVAWSLLDSVKSGKVTEGEFWMGLYKATVPQRSQLEQDDVRRGDDSSNEILLERIEKRLREP